MRPRVPISLLSSSTGSLTDREVLIEPGYASAKVVIPSSEAAAVILPS